jgi:hypothetical protein
LFARRSHKVLGIVGTTQGLGRLIAHIIGTVNPPREKTSRDSGATLRRAHINTLGHDFQNRDRHVGVICPGPRVATRQGPFAHFHQLGADGTPKFIRGAEGIADGGGHDDTGRSVE